MFLLGAAIRLYRLDLDPPSNFDLQFICDEGWWVHNARNHALFGEWILDDFNQSLLVSPTFCLSTRIVYEFVGVSVASSRIIPAISGVFCALFTFFIFHRKSDHLTGFLAGALLLFNAAFISLNRIAFIDTLALAFIILSWLFSEMGPKTSMIVLSGMSFGLAFVTKSYAIFILPVFASCYMIRILKSESSISAKILLRPFLFLSGFSIVLAAYATLIIFPFKAQFSIMYGLWKSGNFPSSPAAIIGHLPSFFFTVTPQCFSTQMFFSLNFFLCFLAWIRLLQLFHPSMGSIRNAIRKMDPYDLQAFTALIILAFEVMPLLAKPFRRYLFLYLPFIVLASRVVIRPSIDEDSKSPTIHLSCFHYLLCISFPLVFFSPLLISFCRKVDIFNGLVLTRRMLAIFISCMLISLMVMLLRSIFYKACLNITKRSPSLFLALLGIAAFEFPAVYCNIAHSVNSISRISKELGSSCFQNGTVVLGGLSQTLALENRARPVAIWGMEKSGKVLNANPIERFHPEYLIMMRRLDGLEWGSENRYEKYVRPENLIRELQLAPTSSGEFRVIAELYKLP